MAFNWSLLVPASRSAGLVVRCGAGRHRVRLAPGRFWQKARCRSCGAAVDPTRMRRVFRWLMSSARPASANRVHRLLWIGTFSYLVLVLMITVMLWLLSDRWWIATGLLYGPRWMALIPLPLLATAALRVDPRLLAPLGLTTLLVVGPWMGFQIGWRTWFTVEKPSQDIRFVSFNAQGGLNLNRSLPELLRDLDPDVLAIQECGALHRSFPALRDWHYVMPRGGLCLLSRHPVEQIEPMERSALLEAGGSGLVVTYRVNIDTVPVHVTNIHLVTPRAGFERIRSGQLEEGIIQLDAKATLREIEHRLARRWTERHTGPKVVLGDFNTPIESPTYRKEWSGWLNVFSLYGWGFGATRVDGLLRTRIDHILINEHWRIVRTWTGPDVGSDHRPLIAQLRLEVAPE